MIVYLFQHPGVTLLIGFLLGATDMFLIAVARTRIARALEQRRKKEARAQRDAKALQALLLYSKKPLILHESRMTCAICWEGRHPGQHWPFRKHTPCSEHLTECLSAEEGPTRYLEAYANALLQCSASTRKG